MEPNLAIIFRYTSTLLYPKYHPVWFLLYLYIKYQQIKKRHYTYKIIIGPDLVLFNVLKSNPEYCYDVNNCVLVHPNNVYLSDRVLTLIVGKKQRKVVIVRDELCQKDVLLMSRTLYHNSTISGEVKLIKQQPPKFASEIDLSLVSCPLDINYASLDLLIKNYFTHTKLLSAKDIITINIKQFSPANFYLDSKLNQVENVYLVCNKLIFNGQECVGQYFCTVGQTTITQSANKQCFIPINLFRGTRKMLEGLKSYFLINMGPSGLNRYKDELSEAVQPFIHSTNLKLKPVFLIQGEEGSGQEILLECLAAAEGMHHFKVNNSELVANVYAQNESKLNNIFFTAKMSAPCILSIHKFENFGKNSEGQYDQRLINSFIQSLDNLFDNNTFPVILFCCTNTKDIPADFKRVFLEIFEIDAPGDDDRYNILYWLMEEAELGKEGSYLRSIANKTHGFYFEDLKALVYYAETFFYQRSAYKGCAVLEEQDFDKALDYMQLNYNESLGAPKVPKVQWSDVGGLSDVKDEIINTINLPLKHPELFESSGLTRSGILLFGPPGTGKTLLAKAVATECSLCFLTVKGPELLNMYVGQSEQNVREVFEKARQASPCIIFFDELDSLAPNRGISGDSGGVMDRVVSQLLAEMDGIDSGGKVFIIGATNRPDLIDPALLRPGRFDKLLYVGPCTDVESKVSVLEALTRKFNKSPDINFRDIVSICPKNITGADLYGLCSNAWSSAVKRLISEIEKGFTSIEHSTVQDVIVDMQDFKNALKNVKPSLSEEDLRYFENLRKELSSNA